MTRLQPIIPYIRQALLKVNSSSSVFLNQSNVETSHYFRAQIIENAKFNLHYYANPTEYRGWISLNMNWSRHSKLVFAIHGVGKPFNGSLICAPFLEFRDTDEEGQNRTALLPVADEGFVFFYNEDQGKLLSRFSPWREGVLKVAIKELTQNL
jgi:hypothetical protein